MRGVRADTMRRMTRLLTTMLALSLSTASAFAVAPAPASATTSPALPTSRPSVEQLSRTGYEALREKQYQKAAAPLDAAYGARPLAQQSRALLLNHAMVDVALKKNAMRAVKDVRDYL